ncbi:MAG TPA: hypothetical protein VN723_10265 [Rhizomicrobium sp.]|nr:hypothetical protein [Rhizomicrobium sp.]
MVRGRIEATPSEQLVELCKARDRYAAMADRLKDQADAITTRLEDHQRERDARRIAKAYEKSIANMTANLAKAKSTRSAATWLNNLGVVRPIFAVAVAILALAAMLYPVFFGDRQIRAAAGANSANLAHQPVQSGKIVPPAMTAVNPAPTASTPRPITRAESSPPAKSAKPAAPRARRETPEEGGFVAKVLQPDGSFKEEHFSASPRP